VKDAVRCPYCISDSEFRRMVAHVDARHICNKCGHTTRPGDQEYECHCLNCRKVQSVSWKFSSRQDGIVGI